MPCNNRLALDAFLLPILRVLSLWNNDPLLILCPVIQPRQSSHCTVQETPIKLAKQRP
jgi:hypothetical protein